MQWSKLKSRVKDRICPELRDRVDFHLTSYRRAHDDADKVWITIDGESILHMKYYTRLRAVYEGISCGLDWGAIEPLLSELEIFEPKDFGKAMRSYLDLPISDALASTNSLIKAFAIIDRRVGKRTLAKLEISEADSRLVRTFYSLRLLLSMRISAD
jgi:hypothetical protein